MFCRVAAKELSLLAPQLTQANVRLIGIGLEELGVEEFIEGRFFDGGKCIQYLPLSFSISLTITRLVPKLSHHISSLSPGMFTGAYV